MFCKPTRSVDVLARRRRPLHTEQLEDRFLLTGFAFTKIADLDTPIPDGTGTFTSVGGARVSGDHIVFQGTGNDGQQGIYTYDNGELAALVDRNTQVPGTSHTFVNAGALSVDGGSVLFATGESPGPATAIYLLRDGTIQAVVDHTTVIPGTDGDIFEQLGGTLLDGHIALYGCCAFPREPGQIGGQAIYLLSDGSLQTVVDINTLIPGTTDKFSTLAINSPLAINTSSVNGQGVIFVGGPSSDSYEWGIFEASNEVITPLVGYNTVLPNGEQVHPYAFSYRSGALAFRGGTADGTTGLYFLKDGHLQVIADEMTFVPETTGFPSRFRHFTSLATNGIDVGFGATNQYGHNGLYATSNGSLKKVLDGSDRLDGKQFAGARLSEQAWSGDTLVLTIQFDDGTRSIYRADWQADAMSRVPGYAVEVFANVPDPVGLAFDMASGDLYVGRDNSGSGGSTTSPARIHRISAGGTIVEKYGDSLITDPDSVAFDAAGIVSHALGSVLVGGFEVTAILPDELVNPLFSAGNVVDMTIDGSGRLLYTEQGSSNVRVSDGGAPRTLFTLPASGRGIAVDSRDNIFTTTPDGVIRQHAADGTQVGGVFATGAGQTLAFGPGGNFGTDLYTISGSELLRYDSLGVATVVGTGFHEPAYDIAFGHDRALYVSEFDLDRVLRIYAPDTEITSAPAELTNMADATFEFSSSQPDATFECNLDSDEFVACTSPQTYSDLAEGNHTFQVRAVDIAANVDPTPAEFTWSNSLIEYYSPILHVFEDDYRPKTIDSILQRSDLVLIPSSPPLPNPTRGALALGHSEASYLDMRDASGGFLACGIGPECPDPDEFLGFPTVVYGRETNGGVFPILQYWFFYPYNNWTPPGLLVSGNRHEGDWEMIQLTIDPNTFVPINATYSWHFSGTTYNWADLQKDGNHPRVYVADGGHGSWSTGGDHLFIQPLLGPFSRIATDETVPDGKGVKLYREGTSCSGQCEPYIVERIPEGDWNNFLGRWGEVPAKFKDWGTTGPRSPKFTEYFGDREGRWTEPLDWALDPSPKSWFVIANSPVDMSVLDSEGRRIGQLPDGQIQTDIPGTYYFWPSDDGPEAVSIITNDQLTFQLAGTGFGSMDFYVSNVGTNDGSDFGLAFENVPLSPNFTGIVKMSPENPAMEIDADGDGQNDYVRPPDALPGVRDVLLSGDAWDADIAPMSLLIDRNLGQPLPWVNLDRIDVVFSQDVSVTSDSLTLSGTKVSQYMPSGFDYHPGSFTATWTFPTPFSADKVLLNVAGEASDASPVYSQLDSTGQLLGGGRDFQFRFDVLPGDATRDGAIDIGDLVNVASRLPSSIRSPASPSYNSQYDVNSDGAIDIGDLVNVASRLPSRLPAGVPGQFRTVQKVYPSLAPIFPPGDANRDFVFDQLDLLQTLHAGKYQTGSPAGWTEGDWNVDGLFDQLDVIAALQAGQYLPVS